MLQGLPRNQNVFFNECLRACPKVVYLFALLENDFIICLKSTIKIVGCMLFLVLWDQAQKLCLGKNLR